MRSAVNRRRLRLVTSGMDVGLPADFERFLTYLARNQRRAPATIKARRVALGNFVRYCRANGIDPIRASETNVLNWQAGLEVCNASVANYSQSVQVAFRWLASKAGGRRIAENPAEDLPTVRVTTPQLEAISDEDLELALSAVTDPRIRTWMLLEAGTGIRPCQMASLTRQRVRYQHDGRAVLSVLGKGSEHAVVAGADIAADLRQWTRVERGPLWHNVNGRPVSGANIGWAVNGHLRRLGIDATSHSLRRWFGARAYQLTGKDIRTVSELLGHQDVSTTMRYIPPSLRRGADVADLLSERLTRRRSAS